MRKFANGAELKELPESQRSPSGGAHQALNCPVIIKGRRRLDMNVFVRYRPDYDTLHAYGNHKGVHVWGQLHVDGSSSCEFHPNPECHHIFS